jgi:hypothetical protein
LAAVALIAGVTASGMSGCDSADRSYAGPTQRDSAGIAIVESSRAEWDSSTAWTVDTAPVASIGVDDGDEAYLLNRVVGATRLPDGRLVVANGGSGQLRFFDSTGVFIRAVGRPGPGPGEFEYMRALERCGADSLFAFDLNWQTRIFTAQGVLGREVVIRAPGTSQGPYALACSPSGVFAISDWGERTRRPTIGFYRSMARVWVLDGEGREVADLGEHLASERIGTERGSGPHPFGRFTSIAVGDGAIYLGSGEEFEVRRYSRAGRLERIQRAPPEDLSISPEALDDYRAEQLARVTPQNRPELERTLAEMPMPEGLPAFTRLRVDPSGNLWARRFRHAGDSAERWAVFSLEGGLLGHVEMPPEFALLEIGEEYVLGVTRDADSVERVRLHRLERRASTS